MMFEIYRKEVKIKDNNGDEQVYNLRPLSGRFLPKLYKVLKAMNANKDEENPIDAFEEDVVDALFTVVLETMKASYPDRKVEELDMFVSQNLLKLMVPIIELNVNGDTEE